MPASRSWPRRKRPLRTRATPAPARAAPAPDHADARGACTGSTSGACRPADARRADAGRTAAAGDDNRGAAPGRLRRPPAPTDPAAIALLSTLEQVCIPAANGGDLAKLAKAAGYRKSGDNYVYKQAAFQFTILAPGSNPNQCHVDIVHPVDPEAPAKPLVIALHNWAVGGNEAGPCIATTRTPTAGRNSPPAPGSTAPTARTRPWSHHHPQGRRLADADATPTPR